MNMARFAEVVYQKDFTGATMKDAYLKACKWYASTVLSKDELSNLSVEYIKDEQYPSVTARLFTMIEENEVRQHHCAICKEMHRHFFINENCNCSWCNSEAYHNRLHEQLKIKRAYVRSKLEGY